MEPMTVFARPCGRVIHAGATPSDHPGFRTIQIRPRDSLSRVVAS
jgi:hypothetical protein